MQRSLYNACANRLGVRSPILPVRVYTSRGSNLVYALLDRGSEETLFSKRLHNELNLKGKPLEVLLITANGTQNLVLTFDTNFKIVPARNCVERFNISQQLVMDENCVH